MAVTFNIQMENSAAELGVDLAIDPRTYELLGLHSDKEDNVHQFMKGLWNTYESILMDDDEEHIAYTLLLKQYIHLTGKVLENYTKERNN